MDLDRNGLDRTEEGFMDLWKSFQNQAYEKLVAANRGKEMPVILWTSGLTEKGRVDVIRIWIRGDDPVVAELVQVIFSNYDALYIDCGFGAGNNWCSPYIGWQKVYDNSPVTLLKSKGVQEHLARTTALGAEQADESALDAMAKLSPGWRATEHQGERLVKRGLAATPCSPSSDRGTSLPVILYVVSLKRLF